MEPRELQLPTHCPPPRPGEMLEEDFRKPLGLTQQEMADRIGMPIDRYEAIVRGDHAIDAGTAAELELAFSTTAQFWLNLQSMTDRWRSR